MADDSFLSSLLEGAIALFIIVIFLFGLGPALFNLNAVSGVLFYFFMILLLVVVVLTVVARIRRSL